MLILVLLGMYFDAVVVFVTSQTLLFRLVLAILCHATLCNLDCQRRLGLYIWMSTMKPRKIRIQI